MSGQRAHAGASDTRLAADERMLAWLEARAAAGDPDGGEDRVLDYLVGLALSDVHRG
jgi:hypothetical protein